jgi:hypothetical protein
VGAWTLFIYATIPLARTLQAWVYERVGRNAFLVVVGLALLIGLAGALRVVRHQARPVSRSALIWLWGVALVLAAGTWHLRHGPEEAMHFVQYGVLSVLLYRALRTRFADAGLYAIAFLLGALLGVVDEVIQWIIPRRFFDFRDILINVSAVGLVQIALARGVRPTGLDPRMRPATLNVAVRLAAGLVLLLMLMFLATPARVRAVTRAVGWPENGEAMVEYGYRLTGPDGLIFFSRFSAEDLLAHDQRRVLARYARDQDYEEFLRLHPAVVDPFAHEMRVHLFRRDRYWNLGRSSRHPTGGGAEEMTVAFREQQILESFFGQTLAASGLDWPPDLRERTRQRVQPGPYLSPVSAQLMVRFRAWQLVVGAALAWLAFAAWVRYTVSRTGATS